MSITTSIFFFLMMPVFWLGIIRVYIVYRRRIHLERDTFKSSINPRFQEGIVFFVSMIVLGVTGSLLTFLVGAEISMQWIFLYESIAAVALLIPGLLLPISVLFLSMIVPTVLGLPQLTKLVGKHLKMGVSSSPLQGLNLLAIMTIVIILTFGFMKLNSKQTETPRVKKNRRGNRVANYSFNRFTVAPLVLLIPGDLIHSVVPFWPLFNMFGTHMTFVLLPFLLGFKMQFSNHLAGELMPKIANNVGELGIVGIILCVVGYFSSNQFFNIAALAVLFLAYGFIFYHAKQFDKKNGVQVQQAVDGIRVIGVKPNTPAAKMGLAAGDLITAVNNQPVNSENQLYKALQTDPTYCKMKVKNRHGQLEIKEAPIFDGSPHEIGIEMFQNN